MFENSIKLHIYIKNKYVTMYTSLMNYFRPMINTESFQSKTQILYQNVPYILFYD